MPHIPPKSQEWIPRNLGQENNIDQSTDGADSVAPLDQTQLLSAIEALPAGFALFDLNCDFVYCNQSQKDFYPHVADINYPGTSRHDVLVRHAKNLG